MKKNIYKFFLRFAFTSILAHLHICIFAQQISIYARDSSHLRISLLTCSPGEELYSTFGHSAFRVIDSSSISDIVYNYGTFNFDDDGFYLKFVKGKLLYYLSTENFENFKYDYQLENRAITEQVLNLSAKEKIIIQRALNNNLKEENKYYKYDFFFDNCTTKPRDILKKHLSSPIIFKPVMPLGKTFRNAIHEYLNKNNKDWSRLGVDILLGSSADKTMAIEEMQFLPDNLMKSLETASPKLILHTQTLYDVKRTDNQKNFFTPLVLFTFILFLVIALSFLKNNFIQNILNGFYGLLFFLTGLLGCILVFMWAGSDYAMYKNNFNLLWAWPMHLIISFFISSRKNWVIKYFFFTSIILTLVLLTWIFLPQQMNNSLIPLLLLQIYICMKKINT